MIFVGLWRGGLGNNVSTTSFFRRLKDKDKTRGFWQFLLISTSFFPRLFWTGRLVGQMIFFSISPTFLVSSSGVSFTVFFFVFPTPLISDNGIICLSCRSQSRNNKSCNFCFFDASQSHKSTARRVTRIFQSCEEHQPSILSYWSPQKGNLQLIFNF